MKIEVDERIRQHYLLEKRLARRIIASSRESRAEIAAEAYNELFSRIPWHSQLDDSAEKERKRLAEKRLRFEHLLLPNSDVLDIGSGTAYWIRYLARKSTGRCVGVDISKEVLIRRPDDPPNLELYVMNAVELDFPAGSFDIALGSQLVEHLHPDDVEDHFASVHNVLRENGVYALDTPSRLDGPHDVSKYFDDVASGFHLREWTYEELANCLRKVGFRRTRTMVLPWRLAKRSPLCVRLGTVPVDLLIPGEKLVGAISHKRLRIALCKACRVVPIYIIAQK